MSKDINKINAIANDAHIIHDQAAVEQAIDRLATELTEKFSDKNPLFLCVMLGALVFSGKLLPRLPFPLEIDYIHATRYRGKTEGGLLHLLVKPTVSLQNRTVVILDDVLDEGVTLAQLIEFCEAQEAAEVYSAVLVNKKVTRHEEGVQAADFVGLEVGNEFILGYGMDYDNYLRNLPGIYAIKSK